MRFYGKSEETAKRILSVFQSGSLPAALAPVFIHRRDNVPCRAWSWSNQMLTALAGTSDARGFRQWQEAGRSVRKGSKAFQILGPITVKRTDRDEDGAESERMALVGFKSIPVFRLEDTDVVDAERWSKAAPDTGAAQRFIDGLPLVSVAKAWGLSVQTFDGEHARYLGFYRNGQGIALGVENLSTWAHELTHAADDRCIGGLNGGQHLDQEVVAELGGAVLLTVLGHDVDADLGGCWRYVQSYCEREKKNTLSVCQNLLNRVCNAVALILDTAAELQGAEAQGVAA